MNPSVVTVRQGDTIEFRAPDWPVEGLSLRLDLHVRSVKRGTVEIEATRAWIVETMITKEERDLDGNVTVREAH